MFAPNTSRAEIAAVLKAELEALKLRGYADIESPYMREVLSALDRLQRDEVGSVVLNVQSATALEKNVEMILRYSLDAKHPQGVR